jgi:2-dehydro-3-deoxyphosphogluconate aldolase / (4S)-4-hydroxy-2-oxoglutarate aldolase
VTLVRRWVACAAIEAARCVGILRAASAADAVGAGRALVAGGLTVIEVAFTTPDAPAAIAELRSACPAALVGAGTVLDAAAAFAAVRACAQFLVSPLVSDEVLRAGHRYGVAVLPGAGTPTEISAAMELGADAVKLFPASSLGVGFLRSVAAAMPQVPFIPTGGIGAADARDWLAAGAVAVGIGGDLTRGDPAGIEERARTLTAALAAA